MTASRVALLTFLALGGLLACGPKASPAPDPRPAVSASPQSFELLGRSGPVAMGRLRLAPSQALHVPASSCQELLLFIEEGGLHHEDHGWLRHGDAARFHAGATLRAAPGGQTRVFAAIVQHPALKAEAPSWRPVADEPFCPVPSSAFVLADPERSGPFVHAEGKLRVHVYLDASEDPGALGSLGTLDADPTQPVPEHEHAASAEVLWIIDGAGTMRLGERSQVVQPGMFVFVPAGTRHAFVPDGTRPLFAYQVYAPPGPEQRFKSKD